MIGSWISLGFLAGLLVVIYLFAFKVIMLDGWTSLDGGIVVVMTYVFALMVMPLLFALTAIILDSCTSRQESGIVMILLFAVIAVMPYMFSIGTARDCTSGKDFARIFVLVPPIAIGYWPCLLVVMTYHIFAVKVMLAVKSLDP